MEIKYLNSAKEFHLEMPLYFILDLNESEIANKVFSLISNREVVDVYCTFCEKDSVFHVDKSYVHSQDVFIDSDNGYIDVIFSCTRNSAHSYHIWYLKDKRTIQKIGQFPSTADFQIPQVEKYRKILGEDRYKELVRGIGLAAHGVGIGSYVYLRRTFEGLIDDAHSEAIKKKFAEKKYEVSRMDGKIKLLEKYLPTFLVENRNMYKILSTGIHDLSESECLKYFETVKIGIEQILDEKIIQHEKKIKAEAAKAAIQNVMQEVKTPKPTDKELKILKGLYGIEDKIIDVSEQLSKLIKDNRLHTEASNAIAGDPAPGIPKFLEIEYEYGGVKSVKNYKEKELVDLP